MELYLDGNVYKVFYVSEPGMDEFETVYAIWSRLPLHKFEVPTWRKLTDYNRTSQTIVGNKFRVVFTNLTLFVSYAQF